MVENDVYFFVGMIKDWEIQNYFCQFFTPLFFYMPSLTLK